MIIDKNDHTDFTATNITKKKSTFQSLFGPSEPGFVRFKKLAVQLLLLLVSIGSANTS